MWRFYAIVAVVWLALSPPLFTGGACTAEFDSVGRRVLAARSSLRTAQEAADHLRSTGAVVSTISPERCRETRPRFIDRCGSSTRVYAKVPVENLICRVYRDAEVRLLLEYEDKGRFIRFNTDMAPFKSLPIPFTNAFIHWGR